MEDKRILSHLNALIINSISIPFQDSVNAQALDYKSAMVNAYTKMKPDSFNLQLQAVLTTYYKDIKGVQGASSCHMTRIIKRQFKDQEATREQTQRTPPPCRSSGPPRCNASAGAAGAGSSREAPAAPASAPSPVGKVGAQGAKKKTTQADAY